MVGDRESCVLELCRELAGKHNYGLNEKERGIVLTKNKILVDDLHNPDTLRLAIEIPRDARQNPSFASVFFGLDLEGLSRYSISREEFRNSADLVYELSGKLGELFRKKMYKATEVRIGETYSPVHFGYAAFSCKADVNLTESDGTPERTIRRLVGDLPVLLE